MSVDKVQAAAQPVQTGAKLFAECLVKQGVEHIYAIPGAKIDALFDALVDTDIEVTLCRHEQNAAFMAGAYGRLTGKPGVVLVTSGPGVSNLATGLLTANTEGDPVVAIGGNVPRAMRFKASHQSADNARLLEAATCFSAEVIVADQIPELVDNAFRASLGPHCGAAFISIPQDVLSEEATLCAPEKTQAKPLGQAVPMVIEQLVRVIGSAKSPVLLLGQEASRPDVAEAIRSLLKYHPIATVGTYQAAGAISRDLVHCFAGRVGLFENQPGDRLLSEADCVITLGFNPVEYDPEIWNKRCEKRICHIDYVACDIHNAYRPELECLGDLAVNIVALTEALPATDAFDQMVEVGQMAQEVQAVVEAGVAHTQMPMHPLRFIHDLRSLVDDETLVVCDIGSQYMWMARYFWSYEPRRLLFSNGQQTLGVALPWAIGSHFADPTRPVVSISGDGGFLFSAMELETAVRVGANFVHFVWCDGSYNMVREQQQMKYGRDATVEFGHVDIVKFAQAFGAHGLCLEDPDDLGKILKEGLATPGPVLVEVPIDYSDNPGLFAQLHEHVGN